MRTTDIATISNDQETFYQICTSGNPMIMSGERRLIDITEGRSSCWWIRGAYTIIYIGLDVYSPARLTGLRPISEGVKIDRDDGAANRTYHLTTLLLFCNLSHGLVSPSITQPQKSVTLIQLKGNDPLLSSTTHHRHNTNLNITFKTV